MNPIPIDKSKTALVVIDLQRGIVALKTAPHDSEVVVKNAVMLAEAFRQNEMSVFLVRVMPSPDGKDALRPIADVTRPLQTSPPDWADIVSELGPKHGDFLITKHQWGAFYGTDLDLQFRRRGITTIVLCGISTSIGVESTARVAYEYGYHQIFAEDAMSAMSQEEHDQTIQKIFPRIGLVRKTKEILDALAR